MTDIQQLTGKNNQFIEYVAKGKGLHRDIIQPFNQLRGAALEHGFQLAVVSGHRDFKRQLSIWNAKANGERAVLNDHGQVINIKELTPWQQVQSILRWSALPGASRHHWGTDVDIYDKASVSDDYSPSLSLDEVEDTGPFGPMHCWLDQCITDSSSFGFFRPFSLDNGGVAPERWHLSYAPLSATFQASLTVEHLIATILDEPLELKEVVLDHIEEIYQRFISVPLSRYPQKY